jgi:hypothetical protein
MGADQSGPAALHIEIGTNELAPARELYEE